ncbi:MAG: hydrogenase maturation nickel metallochaperone HypA [Chlamydiae bacterium]|nr:hydrogenase maturation nickel metallochaperone HypA [Chlamydiota bacterium]
MHEQGIIDALIKKILALARIENAKQITKVTVRLGALSHMDTEHFKEHFDISARGTIAENAIIEAEVSSDIQDPQAHFVTLLSFDVSDE